jgi:hypothetical protein
MEIKPTYVTFEQAKLLKEKGFDTASTGNWWILARDYSDNYSKNLPVDESKIFFCKSTYELELRTEIDEENQHQVYHVLSVPEQWQVVEWLRVKHGIFITINRIHCEISDSFPSGWQYYFGINFKIPMERYNSPQEAYSAAFDYILKELT